MSERSKEEPGFRKEGAGAKKLRDALKRASKTEEGLAFARRLIFYETQAHS